MYFLLARELTRIKRILTFHINFSNSKFNPFKNSDIQEEIDKIKNKLNHYLHIQDAKSIEQGTRVTK